MCYKFHNKNLILHPNNLPHLQYNARKTVQNVSYHTHVHYFSVQATLYITFLRCQELFSCKKLHNLMVKIFLIVYKI